MVQAARAAPSGGSHFWRATQPRPAMTAGQTLKCTQGKSLRMANGIAASLAVDRDRQHLAGRGNGPSAGVLPQAADRAVAEGGRDSRPSRPGRLSLSESWLIFAGFTMSRFRAYRRFRSGDQALTPGPSMAGGGPRLAGLQRAVLHPDGPGPELSLAPASGAWTTPRRRLPSPCSLIGSCRGFWSGARQVPPTSPRSMVTVRPEPGHDDDDND